MNALIDADIHVRWERDEEILEYLPKTWHSRWLFGRGGHTACGLYIQPKYYDPDDRHPMQNGEIPGLDTVNPEAVASPEELASEWLDPRGIHAGIVSCHDAPLISTYADRDYPIEVARAANRWLADRFLSSDERIYGSITVATQDPAEAAKEIRRAAKHPRMAQVVLSNGARLPYGNPHYREIFRAAHECGLAVAIQAGTEGLGTSNPPTPSGWPGTVMEMRVSRATTFLGHLTSLITEGVFTEAESLRIIGLETGFAWLPPYLWRFDKNWKALRSEAPWLTEPPSQIAVKHFRFGTAGNVPVESADAFWQLIRSIKGSESWPVFASNYPRWDHENEQQSFLLQTASPDVADGIRSKNALTAYPRLAQTFPPSASS